MPSLPLDQRVAYTMADAGELCGGLSRRTLERLIKTGKLQVSHIGRRIVVPREALISLIASGIDAKKAQA